MKKWNVTRKKINRLQRELKKKKKLITMEYFKTDYSFLTINKKQQLMLLKNQ